MNMKLKICLFAALFALAMMPASRLSAQEGINNRNGIRHVLLVSIDGMHAVDYENCVKANTCRNLASLGRTGVNYTRTTTSRPSLKVVGRDGEQFSCIWTQPE
jgi:hypothetical protein